MHTCVQVSIHMHTYEHIHTKRYWAVGHQGMVVPISLFEIKNKQKQSLRGSLLDVEFGTCLLIHGCLPFAHPKVQIKVSASIGDESIA